MLRADAAQQQLLLMPRPRWGGIHGGSQLCVVCVVAPASLVGFGMLAGFDSWSTWPHRCPPALLREARWRPNIDPATQQRIGPFATAHMVCQPSYMAHDLRNNRSRKRYLPDACASIGLPDAAQCLKTRMGVRRIVFVGDSVQSQLFYTIACGLGLQSLNSSSLCDRSWLGINTAHSQCIRHEGVTVHLLDAAGTGLQLVRLLPGQLSEGSGSGRASDMASMVRASFASPLLRELLASEHVLWFVNAGLWHALCNRNHTVFNADPWRPDFLGTGASDGVSCNDPKYEHAVYELLDSLTQHAAGPIWWRDSTAVHPSVTSEVSLSAETRAKFAGFSNAAIKELNARARQSITAKFKARVQLFEGFFRVTANRPDGTAPFDMRHWGGEVLHTLLQLTYLRACGVETNALGVPVRGA